MDSFANSNITYDDGQLNREPVPEEIVVYGFKPPIRLPDGSIQEGDYLSANHLNYILNDLYKQLSNSLVVVESGGDTGGGYRKFTNGDIEMWGRATPNSSGDAVVTYPIALSKATRDIQVNSLADASQTSTDIHVTMIIDGSYTATGFRTKSAVAGAQGGANAASANAYLWRAYFHAENK